MKNNKYDYDIVLDEETVAHKDSSQTLILRQIKEGSRVLECGPGGGIMTRYLKENLKCDVTILEIDRHNFNESMKYAEAGYCVNLEKDNWLSKLEDESFDYIIYADVLEHLHEPTQVLQKMRRFLKQDGQVILSVPNVAHGDIIMNLMRDQFNYLPLGLLDTTHIHLFAYDSLHTMIKDAGYYIAYETCVTVPLFHSEQSKFLSDENRAENARPLLTHPTRYTYQFVCSLSKEKGEMQSDIILRNQKMAEEDALLFPLPKTYQATCFFDMGNGFTEENKEVLKYTEAGYIELSFQVPAEVRRIRFDPLEGHCCILRKLEIFSSQGFHEYKNLNGVTVDNLEVFCTTDPQIEIMFIRPPAYLNFRTEIIIPNDPMVFAIMSSCVSNENIKAELEKKMSSSQKELEDEQERLAGLEQKLAQAGKTMEQMRIDAEAEEDRLKAELEIAEEKTVAISGNLLTLESDLAKKSADLKHYKTHYEEAIKQREQLKVQVSHWKNSYNVIANSASWKATKPVRVTLDRLKKIYTFKMLEKGLKCWKDNGIRYTYNKAMDKAFPKRLQGASKYEDFLLSRECVSQRKHVFPQKIKISIVVPVYNPEKVFLQGMIQSVIDQTYANWELCLADGSNAEDIGRICKKYAAKDKRIKYRYLGVETDIVGCFTAGISMTSGEFIGVLSQEDRLHPSALYEMMCAICDKNADFVYTDENAFHETIEDAFQPYFKPDYAPDSLRGCNYIGRFFAFSADLFQKAGSINPSYKNAWGYDLVLRLTEKAERIVHVQKILYYSHAHLDTDSLEKKDSAHNAAEETCRVLNNHLQRVGLKGKAESTEIDNIYRIRYEIEGTPKISILIPNYEHKYDLKICIDSIYAISTYHNFEIIIVENNSKSPEIFDYYEQLQREHDNLMVVKWKGIFNYSAICNFGARYCSGEYLLLLNNDIEVITPDWLQEMLMYAQRPEVGAVGAKLYYPDNTIQHAGVGIGIRGVADHLHRGAERNSRGYMNRLLYTQNLSAVTAACMMLRKDIWYAVNGLDEKYEVAFNDVDLCMRIRDSHHLIIWTPFAELYHYESKSRGYEDTPEKQKRFTSEKQRFMARWKNELREGDPYLNPNFSLDRSDFTIKSGAVPSKPKSGTLSAKGKHLDLIKKSPYFDAEWYMSNNPDLQGKVNDPALHFLNYGGFELRDPSESFCTEEYYNLNEDVKKARVNPLLHYELSGKWENRDLYGFEETEVVFPDGAIAAEREFETAPVLRRRTVILSSFFADGKISEVLLYLIRGLREVADQIIVVGDCLIFPDELDKLDGLVVYAKFERHYQYDFGSYKRGMKYAREHGLLDKDVADELIFINDSCYGPVYPFAETFDPMTKKKIDFWGYVILKSAYKNHISTYFLDFKRNVIDSMLLDEFMERVKGSYDRGRVIATLETELTQYLHDHGFRYEAIANTTNISFFNHPVTLLKKYRVPLVKKKAFTRKGLEDQQEALRIIKENAPHLAELIHYKPFTPKKHHFPTPAEHLEDCVVTCNNIAQKVDQGREIKAVFLYSRQLLF